MTLTQITEKGIKDGEIVNADINASAAIAKSKLASLDIVNGDINASAAIAGSKISPSFTSSLSISVGSSGTNASAGFDELTIEGGNEDIGMCFISPAANERTHTIAFGDSNNNNAGKIQYNHSTDDLTLTASDNIILTGDGVGIGTVDPQGNRLLVQLTNDNSDAFKVIGGSSQLRTNMELRPANNSSSGFTAYKILNSSDVTVGSLSIQNSSNNLNISSEIQGGEIQIKTSSTADSLGTQERIRVDDAGNVGIGIGTPSTLVHQHVSNSGANYHKFTNSTTGSAGTDGAYIGLDHAEQFIMWTQETGKLRFAVGDNEKVYINNDGHLGINDGNLVIGTSGHGIDFSATSDATGKTSELFDDYEEGTWTPSLNKVGATGNADGSVGSRAGYYIKCGSMLWVSFYWYSANLSFGTGTYAWYIANLPYNLLHNINSAYQFIPGGYLYQNGHTGVSHQAGYRWQSNNANGADTLTMYGQGNTTNASGGAYEFSGCGVLRTT